MNDQTTSEEESRIVRIPDAEGDRAYDLFVLLPVGVSLEALEAAVSGVRNANPETYVFEELVEALAEIGVGEPFCAMSVVTAGVEW